MELGKHLTSALALIVLIGVSVQGSLSATVEEDYTPVTPSNCTLDDLLHELGEDPENISTVNIGAVRSRRSACFSAGPYGGGGGGAFIELFENCNAEVKKIFIRSGSLIDAIQVTYQKPNGQQLVGGYRGGFGGVASTININVAAGERIIGVFGRTGRLVDRLGFITNTGKIFGPFGGCGGGPFTVSSCRLRGIHGRSGSKLDSIGFFCDNV